MSSEEVVEVTVERAAEAGGGKLSRRKMRRKDTVEGGDGLVKWERFLPKIALRVLLVEADDSTRQIIAALLRKCSYRVAVASDGLKAWEMLKGKPESVDLILTEVDLPSISGYALLTLIMEHDLCKNIPVIMMSTQDSVNTVYKCMLKGASDYLVKPLRRNELRNLWQHVWRRQTSLVPDSFPLDESVGQQKPEGASENNSIRNHGNAFERDQHPVIGDGGDTQSSSTRQEMEGESADVQDNRIQMESEKSLLNEIRFPVNEMQISSKEAIDFMGASCRRNGQCNREESIANYESRIELDLSLRRTNASENQSSGDWPSLHPSTASAFTRYIHRPLQTQCSVSPMVTDQRKNVAASQDDNVVPINQYNSSEPLQIAARTGADTTSPLFSNQMNSWPGQSTYPSTPIPIKFRCPNTAHASTRAPASLSPSPKSVSPHEYSSIFHPFNSKPEGLQERDGSMDQEERRHCANEQSALGNHIDQQQQQLEKKNEDGYSSSVGKIQHSLQREAALTKFRMKRKDRCFEKKVRYESRKKLAEQRPRIKGQFVRQVQSTDASTQAQDHDESN